MHGRISQQDHHLRDGDIRGRAARGAARPCAGARAARAGERQLLLRRREDRHLGRRQPHGRAYVCRVHDSGAAPSSISDRDGAWRQPDRHQLHRHARWPRGLGAVFRAPRLRRLRGRSGGARPRRVLVAAGVRAGAAVAPHLHRAALRRAGALSAMAAGASAHAVAGRRQAGRSRLRPVLRLAVSLDRELPEAAGDQPRRTGGAARQDRSGDPAHPFAIGLVQLAGGRRAAEPDQGDGRGRAERPARPRHREHRGAGLVQGCRAHQGVRAGRRAACLRSAGARRRRARVRAPG